MHINLTLREKEIFDLLLAGKTSKELAHALKISHATVMTHRKNIYQKLNVHSINELLSRYLPENDNVTINKTSEHDFKTLFSRWVIFNDDAGSYIKMTPNIEYIQNHYIETYTLFGNLSNKDSTYAGVIAFPDPLTLEAMKNMKSFSFTVLGDGNIYETKIMTLEAKPDHNYYGKAFRTENGVISTFSFNIEDLSQSPFFGKEVPYINDSIEGFLIQVSSIGDFNLKYWDIKFNRR